MILEARFIIQSRDLQLLLQLLLDFGNQLKGKCTPQPEYNNPWKLERKALHTDVFSVAFILSV